MTGDKTRILIVDDERLHINILNDMLKSEHAIKVALNGRQAVERSLSDPRPDLILLDIQMPDMDGFEVLRQLQSDPRSRDIPVIFLTARDAEEDEARGLELGAVDYITKPLSPAVVRARINTHLSLRRSVRETLEAKRQAQSLRTQVGALTRSLSNEVLKHPQAFADIVTSSPEMHGLFHYMEAVADTGEPVLITGETGVGKELFVRALHRLSQRSGDLVAVNLAGLDDPTFADALFGHKKGAFTGADRDRSGLVKGAEKGTLFLDEIGDLAPSSQIKLLRLLQERSYHALGDDQLQTMDARIMAATHQDLQALMRQDRFRTDLFYRLSGHHIHIPALRQRPEDIAPLVAYFLEQACHTAQWDSLEAPPELISLLKLYDFPGNVRELRGLIVDAVAQHRGGPTLSMKSIRSAIESRKATQSPSAHTNEEESISLSFKGRLPTLEEAETSLIDEAMRQAGNNQGIAASLLGISRTALNRRLSRRLQQRLDEQY
ncbi:sigma-54-dependent Fis family transcriptional regulator [Pseudomaricurvus alkylphenolicus]|uniref:sigma-54-dependent transcriptional regulator n=1 Tax=Pseudomaricurvus alkylphenolicus TaxID=1306991 RepID=UPI00141EFCEB|nr:sigma-54 dependent transcriptional regulator [Pseudomaricurvus alkylphenolicus]NIB39930.1 sigma-54-dependent Fis family transcriptional regulator [Pseudomaricurvus alkylphenolicus]